jgi:hypothetical protein
MLVLLMLMLVGARFKCGGAERARVAGAEEGRGVVGVVVAPQLCQLARAGRELGRGAVQPGDGEPAAGLNKTVGFL